MRYTKSKRKRPGASTSTTSSVISSLSGEYSWNTAAQTSSPNNAAAIKGSILMSPTSYTLFRGFNQKKSSNKNGAVYVQNSEVEEIMEIDGLPDPLPDFFSDNSEFKTLFSDAFKQAAGGCGDENKNRNDKAASIPDTPSALIKLKSSSAEAVDTFKEGDMNTPRFTSGGAVTGSSTTTPAKAKDDVDVGSNDASDKVDGMIIRFSKKDDQEEVNAMLRVMETDLTNNVIDRLQKETGEGTVQFTVEKEQVVLGLNNEGTNGRTHLILSVGRKMMASQKTPAPEESEKIPVGVVEFGLLDDEEKLEEFFWEKMDQATRYHLYMLREDSNWKWEEKSSSLLLGVLVATRNCSVGRLAVFACEPKQGTDSWRMALLWRAQLESLDELSEAFGAFLNAADYLATSTGDDDQVANKKEKIAWEYLGPDCTKVKIKGKDYVARSYDNRAQHNNHSPRVYKAWDKLRKDTIHLFLIQDNADSDNTLDFASKYERDPKCDDKSMLFSKWNKSKGGKVEVIAVPYHEGTHECTSFIQLLSLLYFVKDMQEKRFVHGDLCGRKMVFKPVPINLKRSYFLLKSSDPQESMEIQERLAAKDRQESYHHQESVTNQVATSADQQQVVNDDPPLVVAQKQLGLDDPQVADQQQGSDSTDNQPIAKDTQKVSAAESDPLAAYVKDRQDANDEGVKIDPKQFACARLIDFDYGGHLDVDKPTYPPGYRKDVGDGTRRKGNEGETMKPEHDMTVIMDVLDSHDLKGESSDYVLGLWCKLLQTKDVDLQIELAIKLFRLHPRGVIHAKEIYTYRLNR